MQIRETIMIELNALTQSVTKNRIIDCRKMLDLSDVTMNKYLAGRGSKIDVYQAILNYFKLQNENN